MNTILQSIFKGKTKIVPFLVGVFCVSTMLLMASCGERKKEVSRAEMELSASKEMTVYVCTGHTATTFHASPNCRGLSRCKGEVIGVSSATARQEMGRRSCRICY